MSAPDEAAGGQPDATAGFVCRQCQVDFEVYKTTRPCAELVIRYRRCPQCNLRIKTRESQVEIIRPGDPGE